MSIQHFASLFNEIVQNIELADSPSGEQLYKIGKELVKTNMDFSVKQEILSKMIILFPEKPELLFLMGRLIKELSSTHSLAWFRLCYDKDPTFYDNIIELSLFYISNNMYKNIVAMDKDGLFDTMIQYPKINPIFYKIYATVKTQSENYKNVVYCISKCIKLQEKIHCVTQEEMENKWWNYHHIGITYLCTSQPEKAIQFTRKATDLANKFNLSLSAKLLSYQNLVAFHDFIYAKHDSIFDEYLKINNYLPNQSDIFSFKQLTYYPSRTIRIGYVSSDFCNHAVSNFIMPILENHSTNRFTVYLYVNSKMLFPSFVDKMENLGIELHYINTMSAKEAAELIYKNKIDVLVDLNGHTVNNRLDIFALNPAPIQMTYLGYPNTTGLLSIRYRLTDAIADPLDSAQLYTEELVRLPNCFLLFRHCNQCAPSIPRPTDISSDGTIILGALNKEKKNSEFVLRSWKQVLHDCPNTKLLIKLESFDNKEERSAFYVEKLSVDPSRLIVLNKLQNDEYNVLFTKIDIVLDTYPYSGTTTTCDSLYNSVPVVTLSNKEYHCHNVSASILIHSGLGELVAKSENEYINIIKGLVQEPQRIESYKRSTHSKFKECMNPTNFMNSYEKTIEKIVEKDIGSPYIINI